MPLKSDLGGGMHGHLGLGCSASKYISIGLTPYIRPRHPGIIDIQVGTVQQAVTHIHEDHKKVIKVLRETVDIEKEIICQITAAVDRKFLRALRSRISNTINNDLPTILTFLFDRYGFVEPEELAEKEILVRAYAYNLEVPIIFFLTNFKNFRSLVRQQHTDSPTSRS